MSSATQPEDRLGLSRSDTATLARSITKTGSTQAYVTAKLFIDRALSDDFCRTYAYLRRVDDIVDDEGLGQDETIRYIVHHVDLAERLLAGEEAPLEAPEEVILADVIDHARDENDGLRSFIQNMLAIIEFDAKRRGGTVSREELDWYSDRVARSVTDGMQHFIGHGHPYPQGEHRLSAVWAAHITHLLRDTYEDTEEGFINIPGEFLDEHGIARDDFESEPYRAWVKERVERARQLFEDGRRYLDSLPVLRCRMAGRWYCARFESILDTIERNDYVVQPSYSGRSKAAALLRVAQLGVLLPIKHILSPPSKDTG